MTTVVILIQSQRRVHFIFTSAASQAISATSDFE